MYIRGKPEDSLKPVWVGTKLSLHDDMWNSALTLDHYWSMMVWSLDSLNVCIVGLTQTGSPDLQFIQYNGLREGLKECHLRWDILKMKLEALLFQNS